jgi:hypothetical protein
MKKAAIIILLVLVVAIACAVSNGQERLSVYRNHAGFGFVCYVVHDNEYNIDYLVVTTGSGIAVTRMESK